MAAAIALNAAVFAVIDAVWLNALPYAEPQRLVALGRVSHTSTLLRPGPVSLREYRDWVERTHEFDGLAAISTDYGSMSAELPGGVRSVDIATVTPNLFAVLGAKAQLGRPLEEAVNESKSQPIVLGHAFWQRAFAGDSEILGKRIRLASFEHSRDYEIVGVMPREFQIRFPKEHDAFIPAANYRPGEEPSRAAMTHTVLGRVRKDQTIDSIRNRMKELDDILRREHPVTPQSTNVHVMPLHEFFFGRTRPMLVALTGAAALILALACANTSSILLSVTLDRSAELATRTALGANRWRLASMLVTEHLLLGGLAGLAGIALATVVVGVLRHIAPPELPRIEMMTVNWTVVAASAGTVLAATLASTALPIWRLGRAYLSDDLRRVSRSGDRDIGRPQRVLVTGQISVVVVLLLSAGLLITSLKGLLSVDLGFQPDGLVAVRSRFLSDNYGASGIALQDRITRELLSRPEVLGAAWTSEMALGPPNVVRVKLRGGDISARYRIVSAGYLQTIGASLHQGRMFEHRDRDGEAVVLVNRSFADRHFRGRSILGEELFIREWHRIVGVINDVREGALEDEDTPTVYWLFAARNWMAGAPWLVVRVRDQVASSPEMLRKAVASVAPSLPVASAERVSDRVSEQSARTRFLSVVLGGIAAVALVIATAGVFGMLTYSVRRRTHELGVRIALGASRRSVAWHILGSVIGIGSIGIAIGLALSWGATRWIRAFLFGVAADDPAIMVGVLITLTVLIVVSSAIPLRRALSIEPAEALRHE